MVGVFNSIGSDVPKNAGSFRRIDVHLRENCITGIPLHPTSCSVATTNVADRVANAVQRAFAAIDAETGMAEVGAVIPPSTGVISGKDPATGAAYVNQLFLGFTGGAASAHADCWMTIGHVGNGGGCYQDSIELDELYHPILVTERRLLTDTEGAGKYTGAPSLRVEFGPLAGSFEIGYVSDGAINGPKGAAGGHAGGNAAQLRRQSDGELVELPACAQEVIRAGETIISISCGGGGFGDPSQRKPQLVAAAVRNGLISRERAASVYKVVLDERGSVDRGGTEALRR
jgi:N-methylhydantoinase B